jgi:CTP synthase (UTP-ammonia lyase)
MCTNDKLLLVEIVAQPNFGKNWQKVLEELQKNKHVFLNLNLETEYSKLNDIYKSILHSLKANKLSFGKVYNYFYSLFILLVDCHEWNV